MRGVTIKLVLYHHFTPKAKDTLRIFIIKQYRKQGPAKRKM